MGQGMKEIAHHDTTQRSPKHNSFDDDDAGGGRAGGGYTFHLRAFGLRWRAAVLEAAGRIIAQVDGCVKKETKR